MKEAAPAVLLVVIALAVGVIVYFYSDSMSPAPQTQPASATIAVPVSFTELAHGDHSKVTTRTNYVIKSDAEFAQLWNMVDAKGAPPTVDFSSEVVLAVFAGEEPTLGYSIAVSKIEDNAQRKVTVVIARPGGSCVVGQTVTDPYQIIAVPQTTLPLTHSDLATTTSCLR